MTLVVSDLYVDHGAIRAVNGVSFRIEEGQLAAVIGANGAGKTTLLRSLSGLKHATSGHATWHGHDLLHTKPEVLVRYGVSHVSEGKSVISELSGQPVRQDSPVRHEQRKVMPAGWRPG